MVLYADNAAGRSTRRRQTAIAAFAAFAAVISVWGGVGTAWAQETPAPASVPGAPPVSAPVTSPTYKISVDDVLQIDVVDHPDLSKVIKVINDGTINYPYLGQVNVVGMTIKELQVKIHNAVIKQFVNPQVIVSVQQRVERQITVLGNVRAAGKHVMRNDNYHVLDALADSGGLPGERPELFDAQLTQSKAGNVVKVDLYKLLHDNDMSQNYKMEDGDVLYITSIDEAKAQIQVVGQVAKAGPILLPRSGSIVEILQAVGPPLPNASLSDARIERNGTTIPLDLRGFYRTGVLDSTEKLQAGDRLVVPENKREITVAGAAGRTGPIPYPDDRKLSVWSVFLLTGGVDKGADLKKTLLVHKNPDGTTKSTFVDVQKMFKTGDLSGDLPVEPGDTLTFKSTAPRKGLGIFESIGLITGLISVYSIFHR